MQELKPCPFCGGDVFINDCFCFECKKCGAITRFPLSEREQKNADAGLVLNNFDREYNYDRWNARYESTCRIEKVNDGLTRGWWHCLVCDGYIPAPDDISFCPYCGARIEVVD